MKIAFWFSLCCILYTYAGYPVIMWMLARLRPHRWKVAPTAPSVSVVLAVHNGAALLSRKISHLLALDYPNIQEIIIVSDGSTDGTEELLVEFHHPRLHPIVLKEHVGKAVALNAGVTQATADVILFVDIRPEIALGAIQQLVSNFADREVGCVAGELILRQRGHDGATAAVSGLYWRYEQWIRTCEAMSDSTVGVYGGFYAIRRELASVQPDGMILDDIFQPLSIIRQGYRSVLDSSAYVYDTWPESVEHEFHRKVRTLAGNFQLFQRAPWVLTPQNRVLIELVSHKVMRLVAPYLFVLMLISVLALSGTSQIYAILAALQIVSLTLAIFGLHYKIPIVHRIAAPASALLLLNVAAVVGLYKFLFTRGPLWKIWKASEPATKIAIQEPDDSAVPGPVAGAALVNIGTTLQKNSNRQQGVAAVMKYIRALFISILGVGTIITGFACQNPINKSSAAKLPHVVPHSSYFPPGAVWTQDISHAPLDTQSSAMINWLADAGGWGHGRMQVDFSIRVLQVAANTPFVPIHKGPGLYTWNSDIVPTVPLPAGGGMEGQSGYQCDVEQNDCHLIVADRGHGKLYEAWQANYTNDALDATFLAVWDLNRIYPPSGRGDGCTSADAAGFPIAPLLFNADELASGSINHAIRFILPNPRIRAKVYVHPATHAGAPRGPVTAPPMGAHFRLKASYDLSQLTPAAQIVARAMQKYGMFLSDGGNIALTAQNDMDTTAKYAGLDFGSHDLQALKVTDFEVIDLGTLIRMTDGCVRNP